MTRPEDQESQLVEPLFDTTSFTSSSSPTGSPRAAAHGAQDGDGSCGYVGSNHALADLNFQELEVQHESIGSHIEETQFIQLYPETQNRDESQPSFQNPIGRSQPITTTTSASTTRPTSPTYVAAIERPKICDPVNDAGFKFGKAQKAPTFDFGIHPSKATDANTNTTQPVTSASTSQQKPLHPAQSNAQHVPPLPVQDQPLPPSEKMRTPSDINHGINTERPTPTGPFQTAPAEPVKGKYREFSRHRVPKNLKSTNAPILKSAPPLEWTAKQAQSHSNQQLAHKAGLKPANKSNKLSSVKQAFPPFPDVFQPPRSRDLKGGTSAGNGQATTASDHPLQSVDVHGQLRERVPNQQNNELTTENVTSERNDNNGALETTANEQSSRPCAFSIPQNNAQQNAASDNPAAVEGAGIQVDPTLPLAANGHHNKDQRESPEISDQLEPAVLHHRHRPDADRETIHQVDTNKSSMGPVDLRSEPDSELHHSFQAPPNLASRSPSVLSNTARSMVRPLAADELVAQGVLEHPILHAKQLMKVQKSNNGPTHIGQRVKSNAEYLNRRPNTTSVPSSIQIFRRNWVQIEEALEDHENQKSLIESQQERLKSQAAELTLRQKGLESQQSKLKSQKAEIEQLELATAKSNERIKCLEDEKATLTTKVQKFKEISAKYKAHMNEVVVAQKHLIAESSNMKSDSAKMREEILRASSDRESHENRLRSLIVNAKSIRPSVEKMAELEEENEKVKIEIENMNRTNVLLHSELNARMVDLGRERHNTEQLQKNLNAQNESHNELVVALSKAQSAILDELTKEGRVLVSLVNSENSIQAKIDELSAFVNAVNSREPDLPPALIKLIEDLYTRIEDKIQAAENNDFSLNESNLKLFEDLKGRIDQLRLDDGAKASLNERISELRESNATLTASQIAKDLECQGLSKRIDELGRDLSGCRDQLTVKSDKLAALRALPKEDPILLGRIHELENAKIIFQGQLNTVNREVSKAKEELASYREAALSAHEQSRELQSKVIEAQTTINNLIEDKKNYIASHKAEVDKARQEIAKSANASKAEAQLKYDCLAKNLEQRRAEAEKELGLVQEKLQKSEEERESYFDRLNTLREELSAGKKQLTQQAVYIKHNDLLTPTPDELDQRELNLRQALKDMAELKAHFDTVQSEISKKVEGLVIHQQQSEKLIQRVDSLEKESVAMEEQNSEIRKTYESFRGRVSLYLRRSGALGDQSVDEFVANVSVQSPRKMGTPAAPTPKLAINRVSSASSNLTPSHSCLGDGKSSNNDLPGTPREALRASEQNQGLSAQRISALLRDNNSASIDDLSTKSRATTGVKISSPTKAAIESSSHFQSPSPYQATTKPLRPANRKSSGLAQLVQIEKTSGTSQRFSVPTSALNHVPIRIPVTSQTPKNMTRGSAESYRTTSIHSSYSSEQPRASASKTVSSRIEVSEVAVHTPMGISLSAAPVLTSSSSLSELSIADQLEYDDEEFEKFYVRSKEMKHGRPVNKGASEILTPMQSFAANTAVGVVHFKTTPSSLQFSEDDALSGVNTTNSVRPSVPSLTEGSVRRRQLVPLKSALRKDSKKQTAESANDAQGDIYQIPDSIDVATTTQKPSSCSTTNKAQPQRRKGNIGSSYNRIASGSRPDSTHQSYGPNSLAQQKSAANPIVSSSEKSPLMKAPARMVRKRSASMSDVKSRPTKPFKQARVSLPNQGQRTIRTVIPDSQEAANNRH